MLWMIVCVGLSFGGGRCELVRAEPGAERSGAHDCLGVETRRWIEAELPARRAAFGVPEGLARSGPPLYTFYPQAGVLNRDLIPPAFADLDPGPGVFDYDCNPYTRNGHAGIDTGIRNFDVQAVGVPVFAVADGTVMFAEDGEPDMNEVCVFPANFVMIDHGGGRETLYSHLATGSVAVGAGESVVAGQQIGLTASSGCSFGPHLHFESRQDGAVYSPFAGACNLGASGWSEQPELVLENYLIDFGVTTTDVRAIPGLPQALPTHAQIPLSAGPTYFWLQTANLPTMATWRVVFVRPDGSTALDTLDVGFFNPELWRDAWFVWDFDIPDMHTIAGTWRIRVLFDSVLMVDAPVEVVASVDSAFNRPPEPFGVVFEPPAPVEGDVLRCVVEGSLVLDDLDWDLVRYEYRWVVDGMVVRTATNAALSDVLMRDAAGVGQEVCCEVVATDGSASTQPEVVCVTIAGACPVDLNADGFLNTTDINLFVQAFLSEGGAADLNADGNWNATDINLFVGAFLAGC